MIESRPTTGVLLSLLLVLGAYASASGCDVTCPAGSTLDSAGCELLGALGERSGGSDAGSIPARDASVAFDARVEANDSAAASDDAGDSCPADASEACDGLDNDCDGVVDEANAHCDEPSYRCVDARCVPNGDFRGALETAGGYVLSMANGGGFGSPQDGPQTAVHTDSVNDMGAWEQFEIVWQDAAFTKFALRTADGVHYVTAVNGGGIGGPNNAYCPIHSDGRSASDWETVTLHLAGRNASIRTSSGNYLSAQDGGGIGGPDTMPIHTDATQITDNEIFVLRR